MKRILFLVLLLQIFIFQDFKVEALSNMACDASVLVDGESGKILTEHNGNKIKYPASLTKLMTAVLALEMGNLDDILIVDDLTPFTIDGSHIALEPEEKLTLEDMLHALLIPSANDAAEVIAINYSGNIEAFVAKMNEKAKELGMENTNFANPHGLHDANHYSTANDMAKLAVYAYKNDVIRSIIAKRNYIIPKTNIKTEERYINNTNRLLVGTGYGNQILLDGYYVDIKYEGATGMKTGYTPEAGSCLIGSAERNGVTLITVVLEGYITDVYLDTVRLFNYGFNNYERIELISANSYFENKKIEGASIEEIPLITKSSLSSLIKSGENQNIEKNVVYNDIPLPISKNTVLGKIEFKIAGEILGYVDLYTPVEITEALSPVNKNGIVVKTLISVFLSFVALIGILRVYNSIRLYNLRRRKKRTGSY
jgi:D-alanyl-D-alanine carboxypeptidase (penicillin-binding protein 5/6)